MLWSRVLLLRNTYLIWCYQLGRNPWKSKNIVSKGPPLGSVWKSKTFPHWSQGGTLGNDVGKKLFLNSNLSTIIVKSKMEWWKINFLSRHFTPFSIIIIYLPNTARDYKPTPVPVHYNIITIIGHYNVHNIDTLA